MIIAQFVEGDAPGGTERLVIQIAQDLRRRGHGVVVLGPADGPGKGWLAGELRALGFPWEPIPKRSMVDPRSVTDVIAAIRKHDIHVLHSHEFAPSTFGAVAAKLLGRTHVFTCHGNLYFAGAWRRRTMMRWAARNSTGVVAVSRDTGEDLERLLALPAGSVHVIPNGIASRPGEREPVRSELRLGADDLLIVALGNVSPRKNHILLLRALDLVRQRQPALSWHLAIAGNDQGCADELRRFAREKQIDSRVHLLGHRSDTENLLAAADIFAMSSLHEGMPLAIMEAMFARRPVITTIAGGTAEMLAHGVEGLLTHAEDVDAMSRGLEELLTDPRRREQLAAAGRARAERQFGIAPMMDAYVRLYEKGATAARTTPDRRSRPD